MSGEPRYVSLDEYRERLRKRGGGGGTLDQRCAWLRCEDVGNAERFVARFGDIVRFSGSLGWLVWDGRRWRRDETYEVVELGKRTARAIHDEAAAVKRRNEDRANQLIAWAGKSCGLARIEAMLNLARPSVAERADGFDANPFLFNCANGTIELLTATLREHRREDLITKISDIAYDPDAPCPEFEAFLQAIFAGDAELIEYVQRFAGYSLTGDVREQCLLFLYGHGSNGKSTLVGLIREVLGEYGAQASSQLLLAADRDNNAGSLARLRGARFVATTEIREGKRLAEELVKQITGGEPIAARHLYRDEFEFKPQFKLWLAANNKPVVREMDYAMWRRIKLVPFTVTFKDRGQAGIGEIEKDPALPARLREELPGILAWAVEGCRKWLAEGADGGLKEPAVVRAATAEYREEMDTVGAFLAEAITPAPPASTETARDIFAAYTRYCEGLGERPASQRRLGDRLRSLGYENDRGAKGKFWKGLVIRAEFRAHGGGARDE